MGCNSSKPAASEPVAESTQAAAADAVQAAPAVAAAESAPAAAEVAEAKTELIVVAEKKSEPAAAAAAVTAAATDADSDAAAVQTAAVKLEEKKTSETAAAPAESVVAAAPVEVKKTPVKIVLAYYSTYNHIAQLSIVIAEAARSAGAEIILRQFPETLSDAVLEKMYAKAKNPEIPNLTIDDLTGADAFIFGLPTRYGNPPAQFKSFWDSTGGLWQSGALVGKPYSVFFSTATQGGGQETTVMSSLPNFTHHGMIFVPIGYSSPLLFKLDEVHGGSPWGAGTLAGGDGSRQPSQLEKDIATHHGQYFTGIASALQVGRQLLK